MNVTALAEVRQQRAAEALKSHIKASGCDIFILFASAYHDYFGLLDRYEVKCNIERYERSAEVPAYIISYLKKLQ